MTDRHTDRQTDRHTDSQTHRQSDTQRDKLTDSQTNWQNGEDGQIGRQAGVKRLIGI